MCEVKPGPRCASDTCEQNIARQAQYQDAHPGGPDVEPLTASFIPHPETDVALDALFEAIGGRSRGRADEVGELHLALISSPDGLGALTEQLVYSRKPERRERLLRAFRTGWDRYVNTHGEPPAVPQPDGWRDVEPLTDMEEISKASHDLYGYDRSPLLGRAREAMRRYMSRIDTFPPGEPTTSVYDTQKVADALGADLSDVPDNVVAFDVESDTSGGHGLQPHRAQLTELVLTTKAETIVLAGDERHILQGFADFMNRQKEPMTALGWNSRGYDLCFMAVRARVHQIDGWALELADSDIEAPYPPTGGFKKAQRMRWKTPSGVTHYDEDLMLTYSRQRDIRSAKLKAAAAGTGMTPVEVDRSRLHELSAEERERYVCSDGIATLVMWGDTRRFAAQQATARMAQATDGQQSEAA